MVKKVPFKPNAHRLLVEPEEPEAQTRGGIEIPRSAREQRFQGIVVAVGAFCDYRIGQRVIYGYHAGTNINLDGVTYRLLHDSEIHGELLLVESTTVLDEPSPPAMAMHVDSDAPAPMDVSSVIWTTNLEGL